MNPRSIVGMPVVSVAEAGKLGYVTDLLYGLNPLCIPAVRVHGDDDELIVPFDTVGSIGSDAITVRDQSAASPFTSLSSDGLIGEKEIHALKIVDESGTFLGTVKSVEIEPSSGRVRRISSERGGVMGVGAEVRTFEADAIRHVGREIVTVADAAIA